MLESRTFRAAVRCTKKLANASNTGLVELAAFLQQKK
jgi:hypothetical protein